MVRIVGDMERDRQAATVAKASFYWAHDFFGWQPERS